jgi:hypothetical protein
MMMSSTAARGDTLALHLVGKQRLGHLHAVLHETCATSRSVPTSNVTVRRYEPSLELTDDM